MFEREAMGLMSARCGSGWRTGLAATLAALAGLAVVAPSVQAGKIVDRIVAGSSAPGTGAGEFQGSRGIAVNYGSVDDDTVDPLGDSTDGLVYVVDAGANGTFRVQVFAPDGEFRFMWGRGVLSGINAPEVCTADDLPCMDAPAGVQGGMFNQPRGIAIDQDTGHVFVRDSGNRRVQQFQADGTFVKAWGWGVATGAAAYEVCTTQAACQAGRVGDAEGDGNGGQFASVSSVQNSTGIAVVPAGPAGSPNPNAGNVIVTDPGNRRLQEFDPTAAGDGTFVRLWGFDVVTTGSPGDDTDTDGDGPDLANQLEICTSTAVGVCKTAADQGAGGAQRPPGWFRNNQPIHVAVGPAGTVYADNIGPSSSISGGASFRVDSFDSAQTDPDVLALSSFVVHELVDSTEEVDPGRETRGLDVDWSSGNLLVARTSGRAIIVVEVADPAGSPSLADAHYVDSGIEARGVAGDPGSGELFLTDLLRVFAADDDGALPALVSVEPPSGVSSRGAVLGGVVNSDGSLGTDWRLEVSRDGSSWSTVSSGSIPGGDVDVSVSGVASGLRPNTLYLARLVTNKEFGNPPVVSAELTFRTHTERPELAAVRADGVEDTSVRLSGRVNPHSTQTSYRFEWGQGNFHNVVPVPDGLVGSGPEFVFVSQRLSGLEPDTVYQFRLVATSVSEGASTSPTKTFRTRAVPAGQGRGFELVSPPDKVGAIGLGWWYNGPAATHLSGMAAYDGDRFAANSHNGGTMLDDSPFALANEVAFADRVGDNVGWQSHPSVPGPMYRSQPYRNALPRAGASDDLSLMGWLSNGGLLAPFPDMADWHDGLVDNPLFVGDWQGRWAIFGPTEVERPAPPPAQPQFPQIASNGDVQGPAVVAAGGGYVVQGSLMRGLEEGDRDPSVDMVARPAGSVYLADFSLGISDGFPGGGVRRLVQVCSEETVLAARQDVGGVFRLVERDCPDPASNRDAALVSPRGATIQHIAGTNPTSVTDSVISGDGSRVFFMSPDPAAAGVPSMGCTGSGQATVCPRQLFVYQRNPGGGTVTRWLSRPVAELLGDQAASLAGEAIFEGASADGSRVFFRTNQPLTADDPNGQPVSPTDPRPVVDGTPSNNSWDLYMFELADGPDPTGPGSKLTRISGGPTGDGDCNSPLGGQDAVGGLRFVSADGHRAYFTCAAPLPGVSAPADPTRTTSPDGTATTSNQSNLYMYADAGAGQEWRFVARLPRGTGDSVAACATTSLVDSSPVGHVGGTGGANTGFSSGRCARGSSDGGFVTLWTQARLTVDDPDQASMDIYGYDANSDELVRITAPQGGVGNPYRCGNSGTAADTDCFGDPGYQHMRPMLGVATDPLVSGDRVAFFQSASRLVPEDVDEAYDVYQWRNGELSLASTGKSSTDGAFYKGNDRTGRNVYMVTRDRLTWQDHDAVLDVYTARIDGGIPQPPPTPTCAVLAHACRGGGTPPALPTGDSDQPGGTNASPGVRPQLRVGRVGVRARRRAARRGVLALRVGSNVAGRVRAVGRARVRVGGRGRTRMARRVVGSRVVRLARPGTVVVRLRLSKAARRQLRAGRRLRVSVRVDQRGARARSATVLLRRGRR